MEHWVFGVNHIFTSWLKLKPLFHKFCFNKYKNSYLPLHISSTVKLNIGYILTTHNSSGSTKCLQVWTWFTLFPHQIPPLCGELHIFTMENETPAEYNIMKSMWETFLPHVIPPPVEFSSHVCHWVVWQSMRHNIWLPLLSWQLSP